jgi:hypothetical protein
MRGKVIANLPFVDHLEQQSGEDNPTIDGDPGHSNLANDANFAERLGHSPLSKEFSAPRISK